MRIALISEHASPLAPLGGVDAGGQNVHVAALALALAERGNEVTVHTRRTAPDQPYTVVMAPGVTVNHVPAGPPEPVPKDELLPYMPAFAAHLARRWAADPPEVAHAHFWMSGLATLWAADGLGIPVVQTFHALGTVKRRWQGGLDTSPPQRLLVEREVGRRVHSVIATCGDEVRELVAMGVPEGRISVVPCGVDLELFRPDGPVGPVPGLAPGGGRPRVLSIGRLVPRKGVDTVVRAMREVPGAELVIAGGAPDDDEGVRLCALAEAYGLADRVHLIGSVARAHVPALMRSADVVVSVPWYEPFGIVPVEALACGVPVIASAVGGHLDTVAGCGLLVPPRLPGALSRVLRGVLSCAELRAALSMAGPRRARARYGWPKVAAQTESVYRTLIDDRVGSRAGLDRLHGMEGLAGRGRTGRLAVAGG